MKKLFALLLALVMMMSLVACGETPETTAPTTTPTTAPTEPAIQLPESALKMMETIWAAWEFEYKDYFMGGGYTNMVNGAPGAVETTDVDSLQFLFYVPEANIANVQSAASAMHGMNANIFTAAAFQVEDAAAFAATMKDTLMSTQFVCGSPAYLIVYTLGNGYVVYSFGETENVESFRTALTTAYADAVSIFDGPMA